VPRSRVPPPSWGRPRSWLTVSADDTIAAMIGETTEETDETIDAIGAEL